MSVLMMMTICVTVGIGFKCKKDFSDTNYVDVVCPPRPSGVSSQNLGFPCIIFAIVEATDFKVATQLGFAKPYIIV